MIFGELFCNFLITLLCIAKEVHFKQTAFNNLLCTEASSQLFYSLSLVLFTTNFLYKTSRLPFIFVHVRRDTSLFKLKRYAFPSSLRGLLWRFLVVEYMKNPMGR